MKKNTGRRSFLRKISVGSISAGVLPGMLLANGEVHAGIAEDRKGRANRRTAGRAYNAAYKGEYLNRVAFPIGGLGAGTFCLEGTGAISHMSVRHKPDVFNEPGVFGALYVKGEKETAKILEGPSPDWKRFGQPNSGNGSSGSIFGLPRFQNASFLARFPFATVALDDAEMPVKAEITGWSPFIPSDADNSGLPVGALLYTFVNSGHSDIECVFSFHAKNFMKHGDGGKDTIGALRNGFVLRNDASEEKPSVQGEFAVFSDQENTVIDHCWFRGGWFDPLTITWENIRSGKVNAVDPVESGAPGASLFVPFKLSAGEKKTVRVLTAWYVPVTDLRYGEDGVADKCDANSACCSSSGELGASVADNNYAAGKYKPWYSSKFKNTEEVANYWTSRYAELEKNTRLFTDAFYSSTLPDEVMEAVAANLTILKSPTVMRQYDGRLWSFEGCGDKSGCCHGSCTHVWNYAQAIPHLFPALERTLRHTEFCESQNEEGHQTFRANLPIRPPKHNFHAAADGQLGGIMKVYREWRISGDRQWLETMYPLTKASLDYCIRTWDPRQNGIVEEPHHNTYDIEFWGPDGMCTSFYLGALTAMMEMGKFLNRKKDVASYKKLYDRGRKYLETELFDGEYFYQKIQVEGLNAPSPLEAAQKTMVGKYSSEAQALLEKEGPKYQYGTGCLSDGVLGAWIARVCGLDDPFDRSKIERHLLAVYKNNLKHDLTDHANPQRPSYAFGDEGGLLLCSWPKGGKLSLPFVYSDEVWTGIEYQVAAHLMLMNKVDEALDIVRTCRDRYDGRRRNPFNEYECGHWYARALSSYGMLQGLTGLRFDAVDKTLYVDSKVGDFTSFLSTETGFGTVTLTGGRPYLHLAYGNIPIERVMVSGKVVSLTKS
jgi:uncharacterized protein (DUF608 family)